MEAVIVALVLVVKLITALCLCLLLRSILRMEIRIEGLSIADPAIVSAVVNVLTEAEALLIVVALGHAIVGVHIEVCALALVAHLIAIVVIHGNHV